MDATAALLFYYYDVCTTGGGCYRVHRVRAATVCPERVGCARGCVLAVLRSGRLQRLGEKSKKSCALACGYSARSQERTARRRETVCEVVGGGGTVQTGAVGRACPSLRRTDQSRAGPDSAPRPPRRGERGISRDFGLSRPPPQPTPSRYYSRYRPISATPRNFRDCSGYKSMWQ